MLRALNLGAALLAVGLAVGWVALFCYPAYRGIAFSSFGALDYIAFIPIALGPPLISFALSYAAISRRNAARNYGLAAFATIISCFALLAIGVSYLAATGS